MSSFSRLLDIHPDGMRQIFHWCGHDHTFAIEYQQDCDPNFTAAREEAADTGGWSKSREFRHIAHIPTIVQLRMIERYKVDIFRPEHAKLLRAALNDPEWRYIRIGGVI